MSYAGIDYIHKEGCKVSFNALNDKLYNRQKIFIFVPKQVAGFGVSVSYVYKLDMGIHDKNILTNKLLRLGYFGDKNATLVTDGWNRHGYLIVRFKF